MAIQSMDSYIAQIIEPLTTSECVGICIESRSFLPFAPETSYALGVGCEMLESMLRTTRSTSASPTDAPLSCRPRAGSSRPNHHIEATLLLVWYILDLRFHAILLESEHRVLVLGTSEVGALGEALLVI